MQHSDGGHGSAAKGLLRSKQHVQRTTMSALCRMADIPPLLDHLVGAKLTPQMALDAQRFGGLEIKDHFIARRQQDRKVGGLGAPEDTAGIDAELTVGLAQARPEAHKLSYCLDFETCPTNIKPDISTLSPSELVKFIPEGNHVACIEDRSRRRLMSTPIRRIRSAAARAPRAATPPRRREG